MTDITLLPGNLIRSGSIPSWAIEGSVNSASYALTASFASNAGGGGGSGAGFPFSGSAVITGSLQVVETGSVGGITGSFTGSFAGNGANITNISVTLFTGSAAVSSSVLTTTGSVTLTSPTTASVNLNTSNYYIASASGTGTIVWTAINTAASGLAQGFVVRYTGGGQVTNTWFSGTKWSAGTAPTLSTTGIDLLGFITDDGGTNWRGVLLQRNSS